MTKAIIARDPDLAEEALRRDLNTAWKFVRSNFDFRSVKIRSKDKERVFNLTPEEERGR